MSQDFQQSTVEPENNQPPKRKILLIFMIVIGVMVGVIIALLISRSQMAGERDAANSRLDTIATSHQNLQYEYDAALARLDLLVSRNAELDEKLSDQSSEIARLKDQIQSILSDSRATAEDYARAQGLINQLKSRVKGYELRIAELEQSNEQLAAHNDLLAESRDSAVAQNIYLSQKVRMGKILQAANIEMVPINLTRSGRKEKETSRARKVDIFRISFDIVENRIAEEGMKELYLRIVSPSGILLSNAAYGSGVTTTFDGEALHYTMSKQVELRQGESLRDVVVDWHQDSDYERGTYTVEIYNQGYKVGQSSIELR